VEYTRQLLEESGLGADRLAMYEIGASDAPKWVAAVKEMTDKVRTLGPNPMRPDWGPITNDALTGPELVVEG